MVEVFSTNVREKQIADFLVMQIEHRFKNYQANFDLEDCDHILRVKAKDGIVKIEPIINFVAGFGYRIEVLPDIIIPSGKLPSEVEDMRTNFDHVSLFSK